MTSVALWLGRNSILFIYTLRLVAGEPFNVFFFYSQILKTTYDAILSVGHIVEK